MSKDLLEMPWVIGLRTPMAELMGIRLPKWATPCPNRFIRDEDATGPQQLFDLPVAEAEAAVQPDALADNLGRETVVLISVR